MINFETGFFLFKQNNYNRKRSLVEASIRPCFKFINQNITQSYSNVRRVALEQGPAN